MADGSVIINIEANIKDLQKQLKNALDTLNTYKDRALKVQAEMENALAKARERAEKTAFGGKTNKQSKAEIDALEDELDKKLALLDDYYRAVDGLSKKQKKYLDKIQPSLGEMSEGSLKSKLKKKKIPVESARAYFEGAGAEAEVAALEKRIDDLIAARNVALQKWRELLKKVELDPEYVQAKEAVDTWKGAIKETEAEIDSLISKIEELEKAKRKANRADLRKKAFDKIGSTASMISVGVTGMSDRAWRKQIGFFDKLKAKMLSVGKGFHFFWFQVKTALLWGVLLAPIMKVFDVIRENLFAVAMQSNAFAQSLANLKGTIWTATAPALVALTDWLTVFMDKLSVAITYVGTFINALFGLSSVSKKTVQNFAKAREVSKGAGKTPKKKKENNFAAWDTVQQLVKPSAGAGGSGAGAGANQSVAPTFEQDFSKAEAALKRFQNLLATSGWYGIGVEIGDRINSAIANIDSVKIAQTLSTVLRQAIRFATGLINTTDFKLIGVKIREFFMNIDWDGIFRALGTHMVSAAKQTVEFFEGLFNIDLSFLTNAISYVAEAITNLYNLITGQISFADFFNNLSTGQVIVAALVAGFVLLKVALGPLFPIIQALGKGFHAFKSIFLIVTNLIKFASSGIFSVFTKVVSRLSGAFHVLIGKFPILKDVFWLLVNSINKGFLKVISIFGGFSLKTKIIVIAITAIITVFMMLKEHLKKWLPAIKQWVTDLFTKFDSMLRGAVKPVRIFANSVLLFIEVIQHALAKFWNTFVVPLPDVIPFVGNAKPMEKINFPRYAEGGLVNPGHEFAAILGDNRREQEIVSPVSTMKQALMDALAESGRSYRGDIVLELDGHEFARIANPLLQNETNRVGIVATGG